MTDRWPARRKAPVTLPADGARAVCCCCEYKLPVYSYSIGADGEKRAFCRECHEQGVRLNMRREIREMFE